VLSYSSKLNPSEDVPSNSENVDSVSTVVPLYTDPPPPTNHPGLKLFQGTKLNLFGMQIDGAEFDDEFEDIETVKSYQGLLQCQKKALVNPGSYSEADRIPQDKATALHWTSLYFQIVNPYTACLHKPHVYQLLDQLYPNDVLSIPFFTSLSVPEKVNIHMMFAGAKQIVGSRTNNPQAVDDAIHHFIVSMIFLNNLLEAGSLAHVQALAMLAIFSRNYQKPEATWFVVHPAMWAAVEFGLNRSADMLDEEDRRKLTPHDIEMRKRIFWIIFSISANLSGRLGRPLPLRVQDIDIEFPSPIHDCLPHETDLTEFEKCSFRICIVASKFTALLAQLYASPLAIRRNAQTFQADLAQLEQEHQAWQASIPPELLNTSKATGRALTSALRVRTWDLEFQFFLHHPVLCRNAYSEASLKKCLDICDQFLHTVNELRLNNSMESQWAFVALLLAVIFTVLFVYDVREKDVTEEDFQKLQKDMQMWQRILEEIGEMQGN
jgi:transcription factor-like protein